MRGIKYYVTGAMIAVAAFVGYNNFYSAANAQDCSDNSVIRCGVQSIGELRAKYEANVNGTKDIYTYFGLTKSIVNEARVVNGLVNKNGTVTVSSKTVAKNALTAGRQFIPGSTKVTYGKTTFYTRTPSVSFLSNSLEAYVFTDSKGQFLGAVIKECGNPVKGTNTVTPPSNPKVEIQKSVLTDRNLSEPKEHGIVGEDMPFAYRLVVKNTGDVTLKNAVVTDNAPKGVTFTSAKPGTVKNNVFSYTIPELKVGASLTILIHAVAKEQFLNEVQNIACVDIKETKNTKDDCDDAWVRTHDRKVVIDKKVNGKEHDTVQVNAPFIYTLVVTNKGDVDLKDVVVSDNAPEGIVFLKADKGTVSANGKKWSMTIANLGHGDSVTIKLTAKATKELKNTKNTACVNAPVTEENPDDCDDATVETPETPKPVYTCDDLTLSKISRTNVAFTAKATAKNGAVIKNYSFDFGDGKTATSASATVNHDYAAAGTYTAKVTVNFTVDGKTVSANGPQCTVPVTIEKKPVVPVYSCDELTFKKISRTQVSFAGKATAKNGASIKNVTFAYGDGTSQTVAGLTSTHNYANAGTYHVTMTVNFMVDGKVIPVSGPNCALNVTIDEKPVEQNPGVKIDKTVIDANGNTTDETEVALNTPYQYRLVVTNTGNVNLVNAVVTDKAPTGVTLTGASEGTVAADGSSWTATVSLAVGESKTFTLTAKVTTYVAGALVNTACVDATEVNNPGQAGDDCDDATVTVEKPEQPEVEKVKACNTETGVIELVEKGQENVAPYTSDLSKCDKPEEMCPVPGKEDMPANSPDCVEEEEETPIELPKTGLGSAVALTLSLGAATAATYYAVAGRRNN